MQREIEFRGKRIKNHEWIYGSLVKIEGIRYIIPETNFNSFITDIVSVFVEVDPKTIGQYIGAKDINGKKLFEDDVVTPFRDPGKGDNRLIIFDDGHFWMEMLPKQPGTYNRAWITGVYQVGNKHDNPELLK